MLTTDDCCTHKITVVTGVMINRLRGLPLLVFLLGLLEVQALQAQPSTVITHPIVVDELRVSELRIAQPEAEAIKSRLRLSATQLAGRDVRVKKNTGTIKVTAANVDAAIKPNPLFIERTGSQVQPATVNNTKTWQLPLQFSYIRSDGSTFSFRPLIQVMQPLLFNHGEDTFKGILGLGVIDESRPRARERLADPVSFTLARGYRHD